MIKIGEIKRSPLASEFEDLPTSVVSDAMGKVGAMHHSIKPISTEEHLAGTAVTVKCKPDDNLVLHRAIYEAQEGDVLVVDVDIDSVALWGCIMTVAARKRSIKGLVTNGYIRDVWENRDEDFLIFCRGITSNGPWKQFGGEINMPIMCGGVYVVPGDIVVGDDDGVVVVPQTSAESVLEKAREIVAKEEEWIKGLEQGKTTLELLGLTEKVAEMEE